MHKAILAIICVLFLCAGTAWAATIEVSQPTHLTANQRYDRNPSIMHDGTDYWLFYTKGDQPAPAVRGVGYNPDADDYVVYYKTASTLAGLAGASETKLGLSQSARPANFTQRVCSATYFNSKVYAFVSSGQDGTKRGLHYYEYDGVSWSGPTTLIADATARGGHVNVTSDASLVYIVWESSDGTSDYYAWDGAILGSKTDISNDNMPKITKMGSLLYVVSIQDGTGNIEVYSATAGAGATFTPHSTAISGVGLYDPCIFNDGTNLYVVTAPWDGPNDQQWLIQAKYTGSWATDKIVSYGGYGTTYWWDYWPCGYHDGTDAYVFFTTETSSPAFSDGEIASIKMDWDLGNDHNFYIQNAIDQASSGDIIDVAGGTYPEYLHITTDNLTVQGAGIDQSIIDLDGLEPYWHYPGCSRSYASRAGVMLSGYGSPDEIVEDVTFKGFTVKNAGLNPPIAYSGTHTGGDDAPDLVDNTKSWNTDDLIGMWVHNLDDRDTDYNPARSYGGITGNTATQVFATLKYGQENDWDNGDRYVITTYEHYYDQYVDGHEDIRGIAIGNGKDILIQNCKVVNSGYGGISAGYARCVSTVKWSEDLTIDNCISSDHPIAGIAIGSHKGAVTITNNICSRNKRPDLGDPTREYNGYGIHVKGTISSLTISGVISDNTCSDNGFEGIILAGYTDGITVENNIVTGSNFDEDGAGIFFYASGSDPARCKNHLIKNNTVTGNIRGIVAYYAQESTIEGNTITTDAGAFSSGQAAIKIDGGNNITVKENTISCDGAGIKVQKTWNGVDCYDNTFTGNMITRAKFAGVFISHGAHDNTFTNNIISRTTTLTRWAGRPYEETQGDGVFLWAYPGKEAGTGNVFHFNDIYKNDDDGMENQTATIVDAEFNWWGDRKGPSGEGPGKNGDPVSTNVEYSPWLAKKAGRSPMTWGTDDSVQEAIDAAAAGDRVEVYEGEYYGAIVDKAVDIAGMKGAVINDGPPYGGGPMKFGFKLYGFLGSGCSGTKISGFTFEDLEFPIFAYLADDITIAKNTLKMSLQAITNWHGSGWRVRRNRLDGLYASDGGGIGILIGTFAGTPAVTGNIVEGNKINAHFETPPPDYSVGGLCLYSDYRYGGAGGDITENIIEENKVEVTGEPNTNGCELTDQSTLFDEVVNNTFEKNDLKNSTVPWEFNPAGVVDNNFFINNEPQPGGALCGFPTVFRSRPFGPEEVDPSAFGHSGIQLAVMRDARVTFALSQNNPNPFARETSISYMLPASGHTTLKIYDASGRVVETLVDTEVEPGIYTVNWDRKDVASGTYFYRLSSNGKTLTKKMTVVR